jgi:hypothetical protein
LFTLAFSFFSHNNVTIASIETFKSGGQEGSGGGCGGSCEHSKSRTTDACSVCIFASLWRFCAAKLRNKTKKKLKEKYSVCL